MAAASPTSPPPVDFASGDHYAVLGVFRTANTAEINKAYKALARVYHPDKNLERKADYEVSFKRIAEAYEVLRDPHKREAYDRTGGTARSYVSYEEAERMFRAATGEDAAAPVGGRRAAQLAEHLDDSRRRIAGLVVAVVMLLTAPRTTSYIALAVVAYYFYSARQQQQEMPRWSRWLLGLVALLFIYSWARGNGSRGLGKPMDGMQAPPVDSDTYGVAAVGLPRSGEEVLMDDGSFMRLPDPIRPRGDSVGDGWQSRLMMSMTAAIQSGEQQVALVFSRRACPWCTRQLPVVQRAIKQRYADVMADADAEVEEGPEDFSQMEVQDAPEAAPSPSAQEAAPEPEAAETAVAELEVVEPVAAEPPVQAEAAESKAAAAAEVESRALIVTEAAPSSGEAFLGRPRRGRRTADLAFAGLGGDPAVAEVLLSAPLRVFVIDAEEFPNLAFSMNVQAFPTTVAWGPAGSVPLAAEGFLDDQDFAELLRKAAAAPPQPRQP
eukprot:TRINITY_DN11430_c0_g1_i1.p1 TRINITY_DN11430_c0_g1~~TRINITY_DN11430_c0_g1_i1.p1  ORF type:complete len:495 (-),score=98.94 TRINITY_DN11430_c0_g1_i1:61-1545(-)